MIIWVLQGLRQLNIQSKTQQNEYIRKVRLFHHKTRKWFVFLRATEKGAFLKK